MMEDLAMHLLEILINSVSAGAKNIILKVFEKTDEDTIEMIVKDDGKGMDQADAERFVDPFHTTRTTRSIGLGLSFLKGLADMCHGSFSIQSQKGVGTEIHCSVQRSFIDTPPIGDMGQTIMSVIQANENIHLRFEYALDKKEFVFDTEDIKKQLEGVSLLEPDILLWIHDYINSGITSLSKEE
jgi:anti-sigma regulatory factor (Ser/Thr protein kinase)